MSICKRYAKDDDEAKDFLQECFIKVFAVIDKFDLEKVHSFEAWFSRVCINQILSLKKERKKIISIEYRDQLPARIMSEEDINLLTDKELLMCIRKLPDGYRNVLNLFVFEKMSHRDISILLGIHEASSRSQYSRAKIMLKKILINQIPDIHERKMA